MKYKRKKVVAKKENGSLESSVVRTLHRYCNGSWSQRPFKLDFVSGILFKVNPACSLLLALRA